MDSLAQKIKINLPENIIPDKKKGRTPTPGDDHRATVNELSKQTT